MNHRGEFWVLAQFLLLALLFLVPYNDPAWPYPTMFLATGVLLMACSIGFVLWSGTTLGRMFTPFPRPLPNGQLVTTGAYRLVRHPMYFAAIVGPLGLALVTSSWLRLGITLALAVFFDQKARREERWLRQAYAGYAAYAQRVRRLVPGLY
jgi:protein-S-isoprenylcysteine O-methyltransferase Ste14